jgi:hypothetical protein
MWEYLTLNLSDLPRETTELDLLNDAGTQGWELVAMTPNNTAYLKREITKKPTTLIRRRTEAAATTK